MNFPVRNGAVFLVNSLSYDVSLTGHVKSEHPAGSELEGTGINFRVWLLFNLSHIYLQLGFVLTSSVRSWNDIREHGS